MKMFSKNAFVFLLCVSVWGTASEAWAKDPQNLKQAQAYEERAFQYIKAEDWCGATNSFLDAYEKAPIIDYLFNAAKAARLAGDRRKAMQLNIELLGQFPGSPLTAEVNQNNKELSDEMTQSGPGLTCPRREASAAPAPAPAATIRPKETPSPTVESHETTTLEPVPVQPPAVGPSPAELPPAPKKSAMGMDPVTIGVLAAGGVLTTQGSGAFIGAHPVTCEVLRITAPVKPTRRYGDPARSMRIDGFTHLMAAAARGVGGLTDGPGLGGS